MNRVYIAWQDAARRLWFPVGRLSREDGVYRFEYLCGALKAQEAGFAPMIWFPDLNDVYYSKTLFPMFQNRVMGSLRPEYQDYLKWLDLSGSEPEPLLLLARGGGHRATDTFEVFPAPEVTSEGTYRTVFFVHGLRYMPEAARMRAERLAPGEPLFLMRDLQNPSEPGAIMLRTAETLARDDQHLLGHCPRYLVSDLNTLLHPTDVVVKVRRVNPPPAPSQVRILCQLEARCPSGFVPFAGEIFQPVVSAREAA